MNICKALVWTRIHGGDEGIMSPAVPAATPKNNHLVMATSMHGMVA